jgi:hypothetical protein
MKTKIIYLTIFLLSGISLAVHSQVLDQSQLNYNAGTSARTLPGYSIMQSFTAGITGTLVEIDMGVFNYISGSGTLKIYAGGDTTGTLLQTTTVTISCPSGSCFTNFAVSVSINLGQMYTFRFIPGAGIPDPYGVQMEVPGTYSGGQFGLIDPSGVYFPGFDMVFKTFVLPVDGVSTIDGKSNDVEIYPNPFTSFTIIQLSEEMENAELSLYNPDGQRISILDHISGDQIRIDRGNLPAGIYFFRVEQDNRTIAKANLVITN